MMQINCIELLDDITINKIAAGEVVERPASVIKELIENSLDAGAKKISVDISGGGTELIRVVDDGCGMTESDARLSLCRHATSKIKEVDDLITLTSMGFRGEALPSIAAVSKFTMLTRLRSSQIAYKLESEYGKIAKGQSAGAAIGTTIEVRDLFANVPARKKFLKSLKTEYSYINDIICKLALANSDVSFKLCNNDKLVLSTTGDDNLYNTIASIYGARTDKELMAVNYCVEDIKITGFVGKPMLLKANRQWQTIVVNNRVVQNRIVYKAIDNAYHSLLPRNGYPLIVLCININQADIDINVHPQKTEVKFADEQKIYRAVYRAIVDRIAQPNALANNPIYRSVIGERINVGQHDETVIEAIIDSFIPDKQENDGNQIFRTDSFENSLFNDNSSSYKPNKHSIENDEVDLIGMFAYTYIIATCGDEFMLIDQHAAHERIYYDRLYYETKNLPEQVLLQPSMLCLTQEQCEIIKENNSDLRKLGFTISLRGNNVVSIETIPADLTITEAEELVEDITNSFKNYRMQIGESGEFRHKFIQKIACKYAIKANDVLTEGAKKNLLQALFSTRLPYTCPHGRPIIVSFTAKEIARMFKRV